MPDNAEITLITINPRDNVVTVRATVTRDNADELTTPAEVRETFTFGQLAAINATQDATQLDGRVWVRGVKKACQKILRQHFAAKTGAIADAINALDPNG